MYKCFTLLFILYCMLLSLYLSTCERLDNSVENEKNEKRFRLSKYNYIWEKALTKVPKSKHDKLERLLNKLDKTELDIKHKKGTGKGSDRALELSVNKRLREVLEEFKLLDYDTVVDNNTDIQLEDNRLHSLWEQVLKEGSHYPYELKALGTEILAMDQKIKDNHAFSQRVNELEEKLKHIDNDTPADSNYVDSNDDFETTSKELKRMRRELKDKYHEVHVLIQDMEQKINDRAAEPSDKFIDVRVLELWDKAKHSGFSNSELKSIEEELKHFQIRISKLHHYEYLVEKLHQSIKTDKHTHLQQEYESIKAKFLNHKRYVKKYHATMINRVYYHKTEL